MEENLHEREIQELRAGLARIIEEIAALATRNRGAAGVEAGDTDRIAGRRDEGNASPEAGGDWSGVRKSFDAVRTGGEQLLKDLAAVIERHPVGAAAAAFGLGFIVATLMRKGGGRGKSDH